MTTHDKILLAGVILLGLHLAVNAAILYVTLRRGGYFVKQEEKPETYYG